MEQLIKMISEKAGISEDQARTALDTVMNFVKDKLPAGFGAQVESFMNSQAGGTANPGNMMDDMKGKLGGFFGS